MPHCRPWLTGVLRFESFPPSLKVVSDCQRNPETPHGPANSCTAEKLRRGSGKLPAGIIRNEPVSIPVGDRMIHPVAKDIDSS
jgi:hypothetical protein